MVKNIKLYNDDCFNVFPKIKDKSIDLFILDLPYGTTACKWDILIDLDKMWTEIKRTMKPSAVICFFCTTKFGYSIIKSNEKWFKYDLIWKKSRKVGFLSANKRQLRQHENIYVFKEEQGTYHPQKTEGKPYKCKEGKKNKDDLYNIKNDKRAITENKGDRHPTSIIEHENIYVFKEEQGTYHPQKTEGKPYTATRRECKIYSNNIENKPTINKGDRHPSSIIENTILEHNNPHKTIHRTEKPVSLLEYLIKTYSNEGDKIMDFTMGSASCGIGCMNTNRKFIGVEKDKEIFKLANNRIKEHAKLLKNKI